MYNNNQSMPMSYHSIIWIGALFGCRKTPTLHKTPITYK